MPRIEGFHHITAIASDAGRNVLFYTRVLGLRLVKVTVNFDDPGSYHLYYGSGSGTPGSILTFFAWAQSFPGTRSTGETSAIALAIPSGAADFWKQRLEESGVECEAAGGTVRFSDPDGMRLELVEADGLNPALRWEEGPVDARHAIHGIHHVVLDIHAADVPATLSVLEGQLGISAKTLVEIVPVAERRRGRMGPGIVHHVAWRAAGDAEQAAWSLALSKAGLHVTPVQDRQYFHSIYFREPGGVLYEIATDNPGFLIDESYSELGTNLKLPPWLESSRAAIQAVLPPLPENAPCPA